MSRYLGFLFILMTTFSAAADDGTREERLLKLADQVRCSNGANPKSCYSFGLGSEHLKSGFEFKSLNTHDGGNGRGGLTLKTETVQAYQNYVSDFHKEAAVAHKHLREFQRTFFALYRERNLKEPGFKIKGHVPSKDPRPNWFQHYDTFRDELKSKLPGNQFIEYMEKYKGAGSPAKFVGLKLNVVSRKHLGGLDDQPKSVSNGVAKEIELARADAYEDFLIKKNGLGNIFKVKGASGHVDRDYVARGLRIKRAFTHGFQKINISKCATFTGAVLGTMGSLAQFAYAETAVDKCAKDLGVKLTPSDVKVLGEILTPENVSTAPTCDSFSISAEALDAWNADDKSLPSGAEVFLDKYTEYLADKESLDRMFPEGFTQDCNKLDFEKTSTEFKNSNLVIRTSKGSEVVLPMDSNGEWTYAAMRANGPKLKGWVESKVRSPLVSQQGKKDSLHPRMACAGGASEQCEVARAVHLWNQSHATNEMRCRPASESQAESAD